MAPQLEFVRFLIQEGEAILRRPYFPMSLTGIPEADALIDDLDGAPHAFVIGCLMARQTKEEVAFSIPHRFRERFGSFDFDKLAAAPLERVTEIFCQPPTLHRFKRDMAKVFRLAIRRIGAEYGGVASRIWTDRPDSATLVSRFAEFDGAGPKIASMAANMLARDFKIPLRDLRAIDISPDVHVRRVFARLGLVGKDPTPAEVIARARELHPDYPGVFDRPVFDIGRRWCRPNSPNCAECPLKRCHSSTDIQR
jgi:endonuclease III